MVPTCYGRDHGQVVGVGAAPHRDCRHQSVAEVALTTADQLMMTTTEQSVQATVAQQEKLIGYGLEGRAAHSKLLNVVTQNCTP